MLTLPPPRNLCVSQSCLSLLSLLRSRLRHEGSTCASTTLMPNGGLTFHPSQMYGSKNIRVMIAAWNVLFWCLIFFFYSSLYIFVKKEEKSNGLNRTELLVCELNCVWLFRRLWENWFHADKKRLKFTWLPESGVSLPSSVALLSLGNVFKVAK